MPAKTLIVCRTEAQKREAQLAFGRKTFHYELLLSALTGHRFQKIIVVAGGPWSADELREIREHMPTRLEVGGELYVL